MHKYASPIYLITYQVHRSLCAIRQMQWSFKHALSHVPISMPYFWDASIFRPRRRDLSDASIF
jgi:hypothetical protein